MDSDKDQEEVTGIDPWGVYYDTIAPTIKFPGGTPFWQRAKRKNELEPMEDLIDKHMRRLRDYEQNEQEGRGREGGREGGRREKGQNSPSRMSGRQRSVSMSETTGISERALLRTDKNHSQQQHQQYSSLSSSQRSFQGPPSRQGSPSRQDRRYSTTSLIGMNERYGSKQIERRNSRSVGQPSSSRQRDERSRSPRAHQTAINYRDRGSQIPVSRNLQQSSPISVRGFINKSIPTLSVGSPQKKIPDCNICGNSFRFERDFNLHIGRQMACEDHECKEKFCSLDDRKEHYEKDHSDQTFGDEVIYKCHLCPKTFQRTSSRTKHVNLHEKYNFKCKYCGEPFECQRDQKQHEIMKVIKWVCPVRGCTNQDSSRVSFCCGELLKRHHIEKHEGISYKEPEKKFKCILCGKNTRNAPESVRHWEECHEQKKRGSK